MSLVYLLIFPRNHNSYQRSVCFAYPHRFFPPPLFSRVVMTHFKADHIWYLLLGGKTSISQIDDKAAKHDAVPSIFHLEPSSRERVNLFMAVPTIYSKLLQHYDEHTSHSDYWRSFIKAICEQNIRLGLLSIFYYLFNN